ncbi:MAG: CHRD domain-containing protein [Nitrososphaeraceae archaeon]
MVTKNSRILQASVISALLLVSAISIIQSSTAQVEGKFTAELKPREGSTASGKATFELQGDEKAVMYSINGTGLNNITNIAISEKTASGRGPDVVTIYSDIQSGKMQPEGNSIAKGNFTASDLQGPLEGKTLVDFVKEISDGNLFLRVSTPDYELGEIYGDVTAGGNGGNVSAGGNGDNGDNGGNDGDAIAD